MTCLLLVTGCVTNPYPANWAPPLHDAGENCDGLSGFFENFGVWDNGDRVVMATLFFPLQVSESLMLNYERLAVTRLSLALTDESTLHIQGWVEKELLLDRQFARDEFECLGQYLVLRDTSWRLDGVPPFLPAIAHSTVERLLYKTEDGSLVMENHEFSAGALVVVPIALKARYWFRFESSPATRPAADTVKLPHGVRLQPPTPQVLLPPDDAPDWSGYGQATDCLARASSIKAGPKLADSYLLGGRSTQAFLLQDREDSLVPYGIIRGKDWLPATHELRVEKQHREAPDLADRYVLCLLEKGYRWDGG